MKPDRAFHAYKLGRSEAPQFEGEGTRYPRFVLAISRFFRFKCLYV